MAKTKKAPAAVATTEFADKTGFVLAVGDQVRYEHTTSQHSGRLGIITAIHLRENRDSIDIATVEFLYDSHWQAAPAMPAGSANLVFIERPAFVVGERARVQWADADNYTSRDHTYTGQEGEVVRIFPNAPFPDLILLEFKNVKLEECEFQASDLVRTALAGPAAEAAAPEPAPVATDAPAEFRMISLEEIIVTRNTRQVFDETALAELAQSIRERGVIAPIVVRRNPSLGHPDEAFFELVAGERRLRASKLAGLLEIPAMVRVLDDRAFIEVQLLENLQRQDVRPSDEAQAFAELLNKHKFSAEEIALKVGKPVKFVLQRAKLMTLIPFWMELLEAERLPLVAAHELARLPPHSQVVVKKWIENSYNFELKQGGLIQADTIRRAINQEVMRQLAGAAFPKEDPTLCLAAGPCTTCPKNSANNRGLFEDAATDAQTGKCLDAACFAQKKEAFVLRRQKEVAGTDVPLISSSYASPPKGALGYKFYDLAKQGDKGAVPALVVDGTEAGQTKWVKLNKNAPNAEAVAQDNKAEKEATIRVNRVKKMTNELLADELRDTFTEELLYTDPMANRSAARALLGHWLRSAFTFGRTRTPNDTLSYLVKQYGWQEPTETDLDNRYESDGPNPHKQYINRQLDAMPSLLDLVALFFDLKIRDGLDQTEYTSNQANLVKVLPKRYQTDFDVTAQAAEWVENRYYAKKKGATA